MLGWRGWLASPMLPPSSLPLFAGLLACWLAGLSSDRQSLKLCIAPVLTTSVTTAATAFASSYVPVLAVPLRAPATSALLCFAILLCCPSTSPRTQHATVATISTSTPHPLSTGKVDNHLDPKQPERKRRLDSRDPPLPAPHKPARRPGHVSHKSASAIPTLSTINILPFAPSPLGSPTSVRTAASSRRPSTASQRSARSWLGKPNAVMANPFDGPGHGNLNPNPNTAADLLRQAMKSNSQQRYVMAPFHFSLPPHPPAANPCNFSRAILLPAALRCFFASSLPHEGPRTPRTAAPPPACGSSATSRHLPQSNTTDVGTEPKRPAPYGHNSIRASSAERGACIR